MGKHIRTTAILTATALLIVCVVSTYAGARAQSQLASFQLAAVTMSADEVWVDDEFSESTPGWGVTHFRNIQDGINAVTQGGTVHVAAGTYFEIVEVNKPLFLFGENRDNTIVDANYMADTLVSVTVDNVTIRSLTIQNCIYLGQEKGAIDINSWYSNISDMLFRSNWIDTIIRGQNNTVDSCVFIDSFLNVRIDSAAYNSVTNCQSTNFGHAVSLTSSQNNTIAGNSFAHGTYAIFLSQSSRNYITANFVYNCSSTASKFESTSTMNIITENTFQSCYQAIGEDSQSNNNAFYHNNFINNTYQISYLSSPNVWDNNYPSGGNHWSDYSGVDSNEDGLGDTPYLIDENNEDRYPLMNPWTNIAIPQITLSKSIVGQGYFSHTYVLAQNQGWNTETVNIILYANATPITQGQVVLSGRSSTDVVLLWDSSGLSRDNYVISAYAEPVLGETDTADNHCTDGMITVTIAGDVTGEGSCDMQDISVMIEYFMAIPPNWDPNSDVNNDLSIDMADISVAIDNFMKS